MLTVKVIADGGPEWIMEAIETRLDPNESPTGKRFVITQRDGSPYTLEGGRMVYVMNEHGKTVANYAL